MLNKKQLKSVDSLVFMLQCEEKKEIKDEKIIKILREKIQNRINENNNILYGVK